MEEPFYRNTRGFTLIELLLSLVVGTVIVLIAHGVLGLVLDRLSRGPDQDRALQALQAEALRSTLRRWLEGAYVSVYPDTALFIGHDSSSAGWPADQLTLVTYDAVSTPGSPRTPVRLRLRVAEAGLVADVLGGYGWSPIETSVLLPEVRGLDVYYLDHTSSVWLPSWTSRHRLPRAVEVRLLPAPQRQLPAGLRRALRIVPAGSKPSGGRSTDTATIQSAPPPEGERIRAIERRRRDP